MPGKRRVIGSLFIVIILVLALPLGVYLTQQRALFWTLAGPNICTWETCGDVNSSDPEVAKKANEAWAAGNAVAEGKAHENENVQREFENIVQHADQEQVQHIQEVINNNLTDEQKIALGNVVSVESKATLGNAVAPPTTAPTPTAIENVCFLPGMNCVGDDWTYGVELAKKPGQALKDNKNPSLIAKLKEQIKDPEFAKNNTAVVNALVEQDESLKQTVGTQTSAPISDAAKKLLEEKNKECSQTTGLCPMIDPDTLAVVGWVPSDKAVFGNYQQAIIARSNLSIGDTTTQVKIGNKTYTLANPDFKFDITAEEASKIKELADKQKIGSDTNNRAVLDPAKYDLGKIQKQLEDFEAQRIEAEKAIADQILQTGDKKYFEYLSPEMKKQVDEILKKNTDIKRAADAALRGDNSGKDKLSDADQAKVEEIVKDAKEQEAYLKNKVEALAKETDLEIRAQILSGLNESQKKYVEEAAAQIALVNKQNEEIRQKNIDIVAQQIAQVDRDSTLSDDQKSAEFEKVSNQLESDSEAIKLATSKAVQQITKEQETQKIQEQKIANIKIDLDLAKQATSGNKTFDDAVKIITGIANGEIKTDTLAKLIYGQITQANNRPDPLADLLSLRPGAQVAKLTLSDPTLPQNQKLIAKSLDSPALQLKLKENYYTDLVNNYYSASDKSSCVWGVSSSCEQIKEKIDKYKADLPPEQIRNIYKQALIKNITNLDNNSIAVKDALVKTLSESRISDLESDVDKTLVETTNLGIKDWQDYQKLNDNWTYQAYSYGSGQQFSNNIQQAIESGQVKPSEVEKRIIEIAGSDPVSFILAQYEVARKEYISKNQKDPGYNPTTKEYWEASFSSLSKAVPIMAATGYNIFTQGGAQRNLVSQSVGYEQKRQEYIQKYNVDPGYDPTKLEYWKANTEAWAGGLVNTVPVVTNGVVGLFSEEIANKYVPVSEYQRNSADYVRAGVAFAAPAASVIAPIAALPFAPLGVVGLLTTGQTAFGSYASLGSLGNTAELCTFRPDMDRVGCGLAFGNTVYMVGNTISGLARGTISIAQAQVAKDVALVNKNTTFQQALKIVKGGAGVKAAALNAGSPIERIAYSLSSGAGAATFIPKALLSCTGAAAQQQGASWADCIVSGTMGAASVFRSLNLFLPFTRNDFVGKTVGYLAEGGDMLDGFAACADLSFNPGNKDSIRTNPGDCILGLYDAFGDNLAKGSALFGQQNRTVTNGSFAKLQAAINAKDEALIKQYTAEAISNLGHLQANNIDVSPDLSNADAAIDRLKQEYQKQFLLNISKDIKSPEIEKLRISLNTTTDFPTVALNLTTAILTSNPKIFTADQLKQFEIELKSQINSLTAQADVISDQIEALETAEVVAQPEIDRLQALKNALEKRTFELFNKIADIGIARSQVTQSAPPPATTVTGDKSQETEVKTWQTSVANFAKALAIGGINPYQMYQNWRATQTQSGPATAVTDNSNRTLPLQETGVVNEIKTYLTTGQNSWTIAGNNLLKQLENSRAVEIIANVTLVPTKFLGEKLSDGLNAIGNLVTQKPTTPQEPIFVATNEDETIDRLLTGKPISVFHRTGSVENVTSIQSEGFNSRIMNVNQKEYAITYFSLLPQKDLKTDLFIDLNSKGNQLRIYDMRNWKNGESAPVSYVDLINQGYGGVITPGGVFAGQYQLVLFDGKTWGPKTKLLTQIPPPTQPTTPQTGVSIQELGARIGNFGRNTAINSAAIAGPILNNIYTDFVPESQKAGGQIYEVTLGRAIAIGRGLLNGFDVQSIEALTGKTEGQLGRESELLDRTSLTPEILNTDYEFIVIKVSNDSYITFKKVNGRWVLAPLASQRGLTALAKIQDLFAKKPTVQPAPSLAIQNGIDYDQNTNQWRVGDTIVPNNKKTQVNGLWYEPDSFSGTTFLREFDPQNLPFVTIHSLDENNNLKTEGPNILPYKPVEISMLAKPSDPSGEQLKVFPTQKITYYYFGFPLSTYWAAYTPDGNLAITANETGLEALRNLGQIKQIDATTLSVNGVTFQKQNIDSREWWVYTPNSTPKTGTGNNWLNKLLAIQAWQIKQTKNATLNTIASVLYPEIARTLEDQRNVEIINTLSLDPELMRNIDSNAILKIVNGDTALAAIIEQNLKTIQPVWRLMPKANLPLNVWLDIANKYNKLIADTAKIFTPTHQKILAQVMLVGNPAEIRQFILNNILGTTFDAIPTGTQYIDRSLQDIFEEAAVNAIEKTFVTSENKYIASKLNQLENNFNSQEINFVRVSMLDFTGLQSVREARQAVKDLPRTEEVEEVMEAAVVVPSKKPKVEEQTKTLSLGQKLLGLIPSPVIRRNALIAITTAGVVSVAVITAVQGYVLQPATQTTDQFVPQYVARPDERNISPAEAPIVVPSTSTLPTNVAYKYTDPSLFPDIQKNIDNGCFVVKQTKNGKIITYPESDPARLENCSNIKFYNELSPYKAVTGTSDKLNVYEIGGSKVTSITQAPSSCYTFGIFEGLRVLYNMAGEDTGDVMIDPILMAEILGLDKGTYQKGYQAFLHDKQLIQTYISANNQSEIDFRASLIMNPQLVDQLAANKDPRVEPLRIAAITGSINQWLGRNSKFTDLLEQFGVSILEERLPISPEAITANRASYDVFSGDLTSSDRDQIEVTKAGKTTNTTGTTKTLYTVTKNEAEKLNKNKILNIIDNSLSQKDKVVFLGLKADISGVGHQFIVVDKVIKNGKTYLHVIEPHGKDNNGPDTWQFYNTLQKQPDNSYLIDIDEVNKQIIDVNVMLSNNRVAYAKDGKTVAQNKIAPKTEPKNIILETRPIVEGKILTEKDKVWKQDSDGSNLFLNRAWLPVETPNFGNVTSATQLQKVVDFFNVANPNNLRYKADGIFTYCNIFAYDVARALGKPIPQWFNGKELGADDLYAWFQGKSTKMSTDLQGPALGWEEITPEKAQQLANDGQLIMAAWHKQMRVGHVAVILPGKGETVNNKFFPNSAQAGLENFSGKSVYQGFEKNDQQLIKYFAHTGQQYSFVSPDNKVAMNTSGGLPASTLP